jgi:DNA-binding IclR family transcriptional regulator
MCTNTIEWAFRVRVGNTHAKLVLLVLANAANRHTQQCWPSVSYIAGCCEISRASVYRAINLLRAKELVARDPYRWEGGVRKASIYTMLVTESVSAH